MVYTPNICEGEKRKSGTKMDRTEKGSRHIQNYSHLGCKRSERSDQPTDLVDGSRAFHSRAADYASL